MVSWERGGAWNQEADLRVYIGLDLGTSALKAVLVNGADGAVAAATAAVATARPRDGWSEQNPAGWISAAEAALDALSRKADLSAVRGIGLSGHMHGATILDRNHEVLRPCILWNDTRADAEAAAMDADPIWREITGNIVFPGFTAPKLAWVSRREPEIFARVSKVLSPKDYLRLWLTGEVVTEMSDGSGTGWLDVGARDWSDRLLAETGLDRGVMPSLVEGGSASGALRAGLARRWSIDPGVPVAGGAGDNAAAAVGLGVARAGQAFVSLGTSGVLFAATDGHAPDPATAVHAFCHALPGTWHQMGVILAAADALNWLSRLTGRKPDELTADLGEVRAPGRALFLPYLGGERTPHNDAAVRGAFLGLEHATDAKAAARAVLEGVAFAIADCRDALEATGTRIDGIVATGGGARSDYWLGAIASVLNFPIGVPAAGDHGAARGAARLGRMAATGEGAEIATPPEISRMIVPNPDLASSYSDARERHRAAYEAVRNF